MNEIEIIKRLPAMVRIELLEDQEFLGANTPLFAEYRDLPQAAQVAIMREYGSVQAWEKATHVCGSSKGDLEGVTFDTGIKHYEN